MENTQIIVDLLTEMRDNLVAINGHLADINTLAEKREKKSESQARWRAKRNACVDSTSSRVDSTKEGREKEGGEKEKSPHTPLKGKEGEEKGKVENDDDDVIRAREFDDFMFDPIAVAARKRHHSVANTIPTLEHAQAFARQHMTSAQCTPQIVEEWYRDCQMAQWCDGNGNPIHNWGKHLACFAYFYKVRKASADPDRIPDARKSAYRDTREAERLAAEERKKELNARALEIMRHSTERLASLVGGVK